MERTGGFYVGARTRRPIAMATGPVLLTALVAAAATWSATRQIAPLDIGQVLRAEGAD